MPKTILANCWARDDIRCQQSARDQSSAEFTHDIQDAVDDDLGVGRDPALALGEGKDDRVAGPEDDGHDHGDIEDALDIVRLELGGVAAREDERVENVEEELCGGRDGACVSAALMPRRGWANSQCPKRQRRSTWQTRSTSTDRR